MEKINKFCDNNKNYNDFSKNNEIINILDDVKTKNLIEDFIKQLIDMIKQENQLNFEKVKTIDWFNLLDDKFKEKLEKISRLNVIPQWEFEILMYDIARYYWIKLVKEKNIWRGNVKIEKVF